jgi:hypothetical protein
VELVQGQYRGRLSNSAASSLFGSVIPMARKGWGQGCKVACQFAPIFFVFIPYSSVAMEKALSIYCSGSSRSVTGMVGVA